MRYSTYIDLWYILVNRKCQDYVYIKWVLKYYENKAQRDENKVNENKVLYCKALRCETIKNNKNCFPLCQTYKPTIILN